MTEDTRHPPAGNVSGAARLEDLRRKLIPVFRQYSVRKAIVFGSYARGEPSPHSDLDLVLLQQTAKRFLDRYDGLLLDLGRAVPEVSLEVLIYTPEELQQMAARPFIATVLREGKVIHESA